MSVVKVSSTAHNDCYLGRFAESFQQRKRLNSRGVTLPGQLQSSFISNALLFRAVQTGKRSTCRSRFVSARTVATKSSIEGLYICAGGFTFVKGA